MGRAASSSCCTGGGGSERPIFSSASRPVAGPSSTKQPGKRKPTSCARSPSSAERCSALSRPAIRSRPGKPRWSTSTPTPGPRGSPSSWTSFRTCASRPRGWHRSSSAGGTGAGAPPGSCSCCADRRRPSWPNSMPAPRRCTSASPRRSRWARCRIAKRRSSCRRSIRPTEPASSVSWAVRRSICGSGAPAAACARQPALAVRRSGRSARRFRAAGPARRSR